MSYLSCIKKVKGVNEDECRMLAKSYLTCRMDRWVIYGLPVVLSSFAVTEVHTNKGADRNLMARDEFKNLGFKEKQTPATQGGSVEAGVKGELRW